MIPGLPKYGHTIWYLIRHKLAWVALQLSLCGKTLERACTPTAEGTREQSFATLTLQSTLAKPMLHRAHAWHYRYYRLGAQFQSSKSACTA